MRLSFTIGLSSVLLGIGCFWQDNSTSKKKEENGVSSSFESSSSSEAFIDRPEIPYTDTLDLNTYLTYTPNSSSEVIQIFSGYYEQGQELLIKAAVFASTSSPQIYFKNENLNVLNPVNPIAGRYESYSAFALNPANAIDTLFAENRYIISEAGYHYLEILVDSTTNATRLMVFSQLTDFSYQTTSDTTELSLEGVDNRFVSESRKPDNLRWARISLPPYSRGILRIAADSYSAMDILDSDLNPIDSASNPFNTDVDFRAVVISAQNEDHWYIRLTPKNSSYLDPAFAFFNIRAYVSELDSGAYADFPMTLTEGDTITSRFARAEETRFDLGLDHYIALGDFAEGDSLITWFSAFGLTNATRDSVYVKNDAGAVLQVLTLKSGTNWDPAPFRNALEISEDSPLYLHYTSGKRAFLPEAAVPALTLKALFEHKN
jgi:hypothetical protein